MSIIWWDMAYRVNDFKYHFYGVAKQQSSRGFAPYIKDSVI